MGTVPTKLNVLKQKLKDAKTLYKNAINALRNANEQHALEIEELKTSTNKTVNMLQGALKKADEKMDSMSKKIVALVEEKKTLLKEIRKLKDEIAVLRGRNKKDSANSSKPSSENIFKKRRMTGTREKSGRKPGREKGHAGSTLNPDLEEEISYIKEGACSCCSGEIEFSDEYKKRSLIDVRIKFVKRTEKAFKGTCKNCGKSFEAKFSDEFKAPMAYGNNMHAVINFLSEYANVPDKKVTDIIKAFSGDKLNMSTGTVYNSRMALAKKLRPVVDEIKRRLIETNVLCVDETGVRVDGKLNWISIFADENHTLFEYNEKRTGHCNDENGILALFVGILMHDHLKSYYKRSSMIHAECNQHILRYLKAIIEIQSHAWAKDAWDFLLDSKKLKEEYVASGKDGFEPEVMERLKKEYLNILDKGDKEYNNAVKGMTHIKFYNEERCLLKRLREYADEHLRYLSDFLVPFGNNSAEQGAHFVKRKIKTAGGFRSKAGADAHMTISSVVFTAKKQKISPLEILEKAMQGKALFPDTS